MSEKIAASEFLERSKSDRSFYFENAIKIKPKHARHLVPLRMRPGQEKLMALVDEARAAGRPCRIVILKARQIGFSTVTDMEMFRRCHLWPHQQAVIASYDTKQSEYLFENLQRAYTALPKAIRPKKKFSTKQLIQFEDNDSRIEVVVAKKGRGFTAQTIHISELAFIEDAAEFMTGIMQTAPDEPESVVIVESTPNGIGNEFHDLWVRAKSGRTEWVALFIPWFDEPTYIRNPSFTPEDLAESQRPADLRACEIVKLHGVSLEQIAWWQHTLENKCGGDLDVMEQEYPTDDVTCFMASGSKVFERDALAHYITLAGVNPERTESPEETRTRVRSDARWHTINEPETGGLEHPSVVAERTGKLWIARYPVRRQKYIVAYDLSGGDPGSDHTPGVVLNRHTLNLDAVMDLKAPPEICALYAALVGWYYNKSLDVGEANNHGILFHHVLMDKYRYPNIYMRQTSLSSTAGKVTDKPGFWTHGENREHLFNLVRRYVRERAGIVEHEGMVMEWLQLQRDEKTKKVDHPDGGSSDYTIAFAMALAVHAGSYDGTLAPLTLEERSALDAAYDQVRERRVTGSSIADIDLSGMTIDDVDTLYARIEARSKRRARAGMGGVL